MAYNGNQCRKSIRNMRGKIMENMNIFEGLFEFTYIDTDNVEYHIRANSEKEADDKWRHFNGKD